MANAFVHVELQSRDLPKAKDFYSRLFDWKLRDMPAPDGQGSYTMIEVGEGTGGGMYAGDPAAPSQWLAYVAVDDVRAMTRKASELGATISVDCMQVGSFGIMSVFADPTGATLALWQAKSA